MRKETGGCGGRSPPRKFLFLSIFTGFWGLLRSAIAFFQRDLFADRFSGQSDSWISTFQFFKNPGIRIFSWIKIRIFESWKSGFLNYGNPDSKNASKNRKWKKWHFFCTPGFARDTGRTNNFDQKNPNLGSHSAGHICSKILPFFSNFVEKKLPNVEIYITCKNPALNTKR